MHPDTNPDRLIELLAEGIGQIPVPSDPNPAATADRLFAEAERRTRESPPSPVRPDRRWRHLLLGAAAGGILGSALTAVGFTLFRPAPSTAVVNDSPEVGTVPPPPPPILEEAYLEADGVLRGSVLPGTDYRQQVRLAGGRTGWVYRIDPDEAARLAEVPAANGRREASVPVTFAPRPGKHWVVLALTGPGEGPHSPAAALGSWLDSDDRDRLQHADHDAAARAVLAAALRRHGWTGTDADLVVLSHLTIAPTPEDC